MVELGINEDAPFDSYKVVLFFDSNSEEYHWYRQNYDGTWSHKPGSEAVTDLDESGNIIYNPITCAKTYNFDYEYVGCYAIRPWDY